MAQKRKNITKKVRFEVFKRDSFTCQYCGRTAPDVVLELDHIIPVSKGGDNEILNLITSCFECNRGKRDKTLTQCDTLKKQQEQLKLLNEKREQMLLMLKWKEELENLENEEVDIIDETLVTRAKAKFNDSGRCLIKKCIKKFGFNETYESLLISFEQYYDDDEPTTLGKVINYIPKICQVRKNQANDSKYANIRHLVNIAKKCLNYVNDKNLFSFLYQNYHNMDFEYIKQIIYSSRNYTDLMRNIDAYYNGYGDDNEC